MEAILAKHLLVAFLMRSRCRALFNSWKTPCLAREGKVCPGVSCARVPSEDSCLTVAWFCIKLSLFASKTSLYPSASLHPNEAQFSITH